MIYKRKFSEEFETHFLSHTTLCYCCLSISPSIHLSVSWLVILYFFYLLLLPKCSSDLRYCLCPCGRDWSSSVSSLVFNKPNTLANSRVLCFTITHTTTYTHTPSFFPSSLPSFFPSFLPIFLPNFLPSFLSSFLL